MNYVVSFIITLSKSPSECCGYQASIKPLLAETLLTPGSQWVTLTHLGKN